MHRTPACPRRRAVRQVTKRSRCVWIGRPNRAPRTGRFLRDGEVHVRTAGSGSGSRHRRPRLSRRPTLLLGALVAGGLAAGLVNAHTTVGSAAEPTSVAEAQRVLLESESGLEAKPI